MRDKETLTKGIHENIVQLRTPLSLILQWGIDMREFDSYLSSEIQDQIIKINNAIKVIQQEIS